MPPSRRIKVTQKEDEKLTRRDYDDAHRATVFAGKRGKYRLESNLPVS
jgi:hypothetical protein